MPKEIKPHQPLEPRDEGFLDSLRGVVLDVKEVLGVIFEDRSIDSQPPPDPSSLPSESQHSNPTPASTIKSS